MDTEAAAGWAPAGAARPGAIEPGADGGLRADAGSTVRVRWRDPLLPRMLAVSDALSAGLAGLAFGLFGGGLAAAGWAVLLAPLWIVLAKLHGLYDRDHRALRHLTVDELPRIFAWALTGALTTALALLPSQHTGLGMIVGASLAGGGTAVVLRAAARGLWRRITPPERAVVVGRGPLAAAAQRKIALFPDIHVEVVATVSEDALATVGAEPQWLRHADRIVLASPALTEPGLAELPEACRRSGVKLSVIPPARGMFGSAAHLTHVADTPVVEYSMWDASRSTLLLKRVLDVAIASVALAVTLPLLAVIAAAIWLDDRGPVLFAQNRAGLHGRPFAMLKFRTMVVGAEEQLARVLSAEALEAPALKVADDPRVTRVGRILRRTSLDELPQLVNVLKGEMSLVGPRPEEVDVVRRYKPEHRFRLDLKPCMTGPMQVYGRGELLFEERLAVERDYIENLSLGRDLRLIGLSLSAVLRRDGAS